MRKERCGHIENSQFTATTSGRGKSRRIGTYFSQVVRRGAKWKDRDGSSSVSAGPAVWLWTSRLIKRPIKVTNLGAEAHKNRRMVGWFDSGRHVQVTWPEEIPFIAHRLTRNIMPRRRFAAASLPFWRGKNARPSDQSNKSHWSSAEEVVDIRRWHVQIYLPSNRRCADNGPTASQRRRQPTVQMNGFCRTLDDLTFWFSFLHARLFHKSGTLKYRLLSPRTT